MTLSMSIAAVFFNVSPSVVFTDFILNNEAVFDNFFRAALFPF